MPSGGLDRLDSEAGTFETVAMTEGEHVRLAGEATYDILPDGNEGVWVGTGSGLFYTHPQSGTQKHLTTADGLPGTVVYSIAEGDPGHLWLGTSRGLAQLDVASGRVTVYDLADGIGMMEFNRSARLKTRDGQLAFGGSAGIVRFRPADIQPDVRQRDVALVSVEAASRAGVREIETRDLRQLDLPPEERTVTFTFTAFAFEGPESNRYAYRLDGVDADWVDAGTQRQARYAGLSPGRYVLRVRGANHDGIWSEKEFTLPVWVQPHWWETGWFRGGFVLTLLALGVVAYRVRVEQLVAVERLRLRIAGDLHDDLATDLSGIALATDLLGRRAGDEADRQRLADVRDAATSMVDALRDIVWTVDPAHDSSEAFERRVRLVAQQLLEGHTSIVDIDLGSSGRPLSMPLRRELLLTLKEALHNVLRHAEASHVEVRMRRDGSQLSLLVEDDGIGFHPDLALEGHGLGSLRGRAERIGGTLEVTSLPGSGTRLGLVVDLTKNREARGLRGWLPWRTRRPNA